MEGNLSSRNMMQGNTSYGGFDLQPHIRVNNHPRNSQTLHHQHNLNPRQGSSIPIHENFPLTIGNNQERDHPISLSDYNKIDRAKSTSDDEEPSFTEDATDLVKGKKSSPWQRVKWTDDMVKLLITAVSYISEETTVDYGGGSRKKIANLQKKGKWKSVSKVMAERGHFVSPQQCEDKFNDLNKRYKRLNEILGRGTSCEVVENPTLLDVMDHVSEKSKEEVRKILSSKHLHYEEMCSYHNRNQLHLPPDLELQRSLQLALRSRDDHEENDAKRHYPVDDDNEMDQETEFDDHDEFEENPRDQRAKRVKQCSSHGDFSFKNSLDCNKALNFQPENGANDGNLAASEGAKSCALQKDWMTHRNLQLEEQKLQIQVQMLELEKERFQWQRFCRKKDRELEMMKMEIERMKLENERMALELRRREMGIDNE